MASTVLWRGGKSEKRICSRSDDSRKVDDQDGGEKIQSETWPFCPVPRRIELFEGLAPVAESRGGAKCVSDSLQDRRSLGEL